MNRQEEFQTIDTVIKLFERSVGLFANNPLIYEKDQTGHYQPSTYAQIKEEALNFAAGLRQMGIGKGDRIGLLSEGRKSWLVAELGMFYARAVNVPLSVKLEAADITFRLQHSGARMVIVSARQVQKINEIKGDIPQVEAVINFDSNAADGFDAICTNGAKWLQNSANRQQLEADIRNIAPDDLANISYTSGTTADPKGIMLSQHNYAANTLQSCSRISIDSNSVTLTILPWDHSFAHTACLYCFIYYGAAIATQEQGRSPIETLKNIPKNINEIRPTLMMSVPAISKTFRKNIESGIRQKGKTTWRLFNFFLRAAYAYNGTGNNRGRGHRALLAPVVAIGDKLIFSKIRQNFGGRLQFFIGGGALLDIELQRFFAAIGMPIMQGYGLSEASPVISTNALHACKFGSSGKVVDFMDLKICDTDGNTLPDGEKGEIVIHGHNVMMGYWRNDEATADSIRDGWLHTGDMGYISHDGFLYVLGRFKSLLIANDGEKYSPEGIEEAVVELSPYVDQCMLYNNQNPYTVALIVPNIAAIKQALEADGQPWNNQAHAKALELIQSEINKFKTGGHHAGMFPERWLPAAIAIAPEPFTEQNKLINSTMKMVRGKVTEYFDKELKYLYTPAAKSIVNDMNMSAIARY